MYEAHDAKQRSIAERRHRRRRQPCRHRCHLLHAHDAATAQRAQHRRRSLLATPLQAGTNARGRCMRRHTRRAAQGAVFILSATEFHTSASPLSWTQRETPGGESGRAEREPPRRSLVALITALKLSRDGCAPAIAPQPPPPPPRCPRQARAAASTVRAAAAARVTPARRAAAAAGSAAPTLRALRRPPLAPAPHEAPVRGCVATISACFRQKRGLHCGCVCAQGICTLRGAYVPCTTRPSPTAHHPPAAQCTLQGPRNVGHVA